MVLPGTFGGSPETVTSGADVEASESGGSESGGEAGSSGVAADCSSSGPCDPGCVAQHFRWSFWTTNYNVAGTLGYGEHQGNGIIGVRYVFDPRYGAGEGISRPWDEGASQFERRTLNPGGEVYEEAPPMEGDDDDLWSGESHPHVPRALVHEAIEAAALCEVEVVLDERYFNHGATLAESVPNHAWDSFFTRRDLIPLRLLGTVELDVLPDGTASSPTIDDATAQTVDDVMACLSVIDDGFCEAACGNCSYVLPTGFTGTPFPGADPGSQIEGYPVGTAGPYQVDDVGPVAGRNNFSQDEDGHTVWYVGGSSWGRPSDVADYDQDAWPDPDGVHVEPEAWLSIAGRDLSGNDGIPDEWEDPFTHCLDPLDLIGSQIPAGLPRFISGRWGHNSNTDAEASFVHFLDCTTDPAAAANPTHWNANACALCGTPRVEGSDPTQYPCRDQTHTATSYWERSGGVHNIDDFDPGRFDAEGPDRQPTPHRSERPDPICRFSGEPVTGM